MNYKEQTQENQSATDILKEIDKIRNTNIEEKWLVWDSFFNEHQDIPNVKFDSDPHGSQTLFILPDNSFVLRNLIGFRGNNKQYYEFFDLSPEITSKILTNQLVHYEQQINFIEAEKQGINNFRQKYLELIDSKEESRDIKLSAANYHLRSNL